VTDAAPLVSIVIPAYNHARFLADAIDSVLAQDYPRVELIVIDDGSTDETPEILKRYKSRAAITHQENCGQAAALNRGWESSSGAYIGYLSADDVLDPNAVARVAAALESHPGAILAYPDFRLVDPHLATIRVVRAPEGSYRNMLVDLTCPPGPGALFRRSAFVVTGGWNPEYRQMADYEYWLRLGLQGPFIRVPEVLASFRVHPGSQTFAAVSEARADEPVRILTATFERLELAPALRALRDQALSNANILSAQLHLRAGRPGAAFRCVRQAAALYPRNLYSPRAARALANALFNRMGHRLLWSARHVVRRLARNAPDGHSSRN